MTSFELIDPVKIFQVNGVVCPVLTIGNGYTVGSNRTILAGTSGKRYRIMGGLFSSGSATAGQAFIKSASGGTVFLWNIVGPVVSAPAFLLPIVNSGYGETNTGEGIFTDIAGADLYLTLFYITYTP